MPKGARARFGCGAGGESCRAGKVFGERQRFPHAATMAGGPCTERVRRSARFPGGRRATEPGCSRRIGYCLPSGDGLDRAGTRGIAQLVERRSPKPQVAGSSPAAPAIPFIVQPGDTGGQAVSGAVATVSGRTHPGGVRPDCMKMASCGIPRSREEPAPRPGRGPELATRGGEIAATVRGRLRPGHRDGARRRGPSSRRRRRAPRTPECRPGPN